MPLFAVAACGFFLFTCSNIRSDTANGVDLAFCVPQGKLMNDARVLPVVLESDGKKSPARTHQDLLQTDHDEALFEFYGTSRIALADVESGKARPLGGPAGYSADYLTEARAARARRGP